MKYKRSIYDPKIILTPLILGNQVNEDLSPPKLHINTPKEEFKPSLMTLPNLNQVDVHTKNLEILKYIFPFYDSHVLKVISRGCHDDVLQTVLSISATVLENQRRYAPIDNTLKPHIPHFISSRTGRDQCCSSPYCPVNSYLALRKRDASCSTGSKRFSFNDDETPPPKRHRYSPDGSTSSSTSPFCHACRKYGCVGDKFCPLCGVLY